VIIFLPTRLQPGPSILCGISFAFASLQATRVYGLWDDFWMSTH